MASLKELNRRVRSVKNTRKITKAMEMVAAAKLRRAQERIEHLRPFADGMVELTARVVRGMPAGAQLPLLDEREPNDVAIVMFTGDRGLAGALNANVLRRSRALAAEVEADGGTVHWLGVGRKGVSSLQFLGLEVEQAWRGLTDSPKFIDAESIARYVTAGFADRRYDRVVMVYNTFASAMSQRVVVQDLLPLTDEMLGTSVSHLADVQSGDDEDSALADAGTAERSGPRPEWFFEPEAATLLSRLLPTYVEQAVYRALLESTASEHGARMTAMRNASENAGDMVDRLTLEMNRARQAEITQEILEVVGGAEALTS